MKPGKSQGEPAKVPPRLVRPQVVNPLNLGLHFARDRSLAHPTGWANLHRPPINPLITYQMADSNLLSLNRFSPLVPAWFQA